MKGTTKKVGTGSRRFFYVSRIRFCVIIKFKHVAPLAPLSRGPSAMKQTMMMMVQRRGFMRVSVDGEKKGFEVKLACLAFLLNIFLNTKFALRNKY